MDGVGIKRARKEEIVTLCEWLGDRILLPLQQDSAAKIDVSLDDLYGIIKRSRKKKHEYRNVVRDLSKLGITLDITQGNKRASETAAD